MYFLAFTPAEKEQAKNGVKKDILDTYGGAEHLAAPSKELLMAQGEGYVEYAPDGKVVKGQEKAIPKSKYLEDGTLTSTLCRLLCNCWLIIAVIIMLCLLP